MTGFVPMMWAAWLACIVLMVAVSMYSSHLGKNEEDQLFLGDAFNHVKTEQQNIAAKVSRVAPFKRAAMGLAGAMTIFVLVYYVLDMLKQFR